jgi:hypothetical protein
LSSVSPDNSIVLHTISVEGAAQSQMQRTSTILLTLRRSGGISALARQLGETPATITAAMDVVLPDLLEDFLEFEGGLDGLLDLIEEAGGAEMAMAILAGENVDIQPGLLILARVSRPRSADTPSSQAESGVDPALRARLKPLVAMLTGGYISARVATGDFNIAEFSSLLDQRKTSHSPGEEQV